MSWKTAGIGICLLAVWTTVAGAQVNPGQFANVSEQLIIHADSADTWSNQNSTVTILSGPLTIDMDNIQLSADNAVLWLSPAPGGLLDEQEAEIVLIGNAQLVAQDNHVTRSGPELLVHRVVRGDIALEARQQSQQDESQSAIFQQADTIRTAGTTELGEKYPPPEESSALETTPNALEPGMRPKAGVALGAEPAATTNPSGGWTEFHDGKMETVWVSDNTLALALSNGVSVTQTRDDGSFLELRSDRAVLFTTITPDQAKSLDFNDMGRKIIGAYLEGDVRIDFTPAKGGAGEQRITADRAYYDLSTDRAIMTDVVLHTIDPLSQIPITFRAQKVRQLAIGEYNTEHVKLTSSSFAVPTYDIQSSYAYIHQVPDPVQGTDYDFTSTGNTMYAFGVPFFYWPYLSGTLSNDFPLRDINSGNSTIYGTYLTTEWGLLESLGRPIDKHFDVDYRLDYYSERGPGAGIDATYDGSDISDSNHDPLSYLGDFTGYIIDDKGTDNLGGARAPVVPPQDLRGRVMWEHENFFPDDWQVQVRAGYVSDPTFVEQYYQPDFDQNLPYDAEFYAKQQEDTQAITFLGSFDTTHFTTNAAQQPDQFDVERLPEIGYQRIGDSLANDQLTFFSDNTFTRLRFANSRATLEEQGYYFGLSPGLPSAGLTGTPGNPVYREDSRQELDWPIALGQLKIVPYIEGRVTEYSDSPDGDEKTRLFGGGGARMSTTFWAVDNDFNSELFDVHRIRHIIQPEINLYSSGTTVDADHLYDYDPDVDAISDISAAQVALHQRWETMRGGPGNWRSSDLLDLNVEGNFFANQPSAEFLNPVGFRGIFFPEDPEDSVARQGINADSTWHISDTMAFLASEEWNMDTHEQATASAGLAVTQSPRTSYFVADTYLQPVQSQVLQFEAQYEVTSKYSLQLGEDVYFTGTRTGDESMEVAVTRNFDTFAVGVSVYHDAISHLSGFNVNFVPLGAKGFNGGLRNLFAQQ